VANLLIEYIGYEDFVRAVELVKTGYVRCFQVNPDNSFVSDSPYLYILGRLDRVHHQIDGDVLEACIDRLGYSRRLAQEKDLPNGKKTVGMVLSR
jgi:hypothetical protein